MNSSAMETSNTEDMPELQHFGQHFEYVHIWETMQRPRSFSDAFARILAKRQSQDTAPMAMDISYSSDTADLNESIEQMICDGSGYSNVLDTKPTHLPIFPLLQHPRSNEYLAAKIELSKGLKRQRVDDLGIWDTDRPQIKRRLVNSQGSYLTAASVGRHLFPFSKSSVRKCTMKLHKRDGKLSKPLNALKAAKIMRNMRAVKTNVIEF